LLASTGIAGRPHEWFYEGVEATCRQDWRVGSFGSFLACVRDAGTTPNGVFGAKLNWRHMEEFLRRLQRLGRASPRSLFRGTRTGGSLVARHFPGPRYVWIRREDVTAQAVSFAKAVQTDRWHHWNALRSPKAPAYDRELIDSLVRSLAAQEAGWSAWFAANQIEPFEVRYEDLVVDAEGVTRAVLRFLGIESDHVPIAPLTTKISDAVDDEWLRQYRGDPAAAPSPRASA